MSSPTLPGWGHIRSPIDLDPHAASGPDLSKMWAGLSALCTKGMEGTRPCHRVGGAASRVIRLWTVSAVG